MFKYYILLEWSKSTVKNHSQIDISVINIAKESDPAGTHCSPAIHVYPQLTLFIATILRSKYFYT